MSGPFHSTAHLYDRFYSFLDYETSAETVAGIIEERNSGAATLLDVACGTGLHLEVLRRSFEVEGADIDPAMLAIARSRVPGVEIHEADMTSLDLGRRFDAVTCMFSSIGYAHTPERLQAAVSSMAAHLEPGGVLVIEPWLSPGMIEPPLVRSRVAEDDDGVIARTSRIVVDGKVSYAEFAYLVTTPDGSETFTEMHVMGLFEPEEYTASLEAAGLAAEFLEPGPMRRGLAVGTAV